MTASTRPWWVRLEAALPAAVALALGVAVFGPAMWQWTQAFIGHTYVDAWGTQWFYWWVGSAVLDGSGLGTTNLFFYPWGKDVYLHTGGNVLDAFAAVPFRWVFGPVAGYNVFCLALLLSNAWVIRRLAERLGADRFAANIAGVLFAFNPFVLQELSDGRPTQVMLCFLVLYVEDMLRCSEPGQPRWLPARAGLWLALSAYTYWFYAFFGGMAAIGVALWRFLRPSTGDRRQILFARFAGIGLTALALTMPVALPMVSAQQNVPGMLKFDEGWDFSHWRPTTLEGVTVGMYVFDPIDRVSGFIVPKGDTDVAFLPEDVTMLRVQFLLALVGLIAAPRRWRGVGVAVVLTSFIVAIGPSIKVGETTIPNVIYIVLVQSVSFLRRLWWPQRALVIGQIGLAVFAAWAIHATGRWPRLRGIVALLIGVIWGVELWDARLAPFAVWSARIPPAYTCLAEGGPGAVLELPYGYTQEHLYFQTAHGRPIFGGMVEDNPVFTPPEQQAMVRSNTFVRALMEVSAGGEGPMIMPAGDTRAVRDLGYRYVVLQKSAYEDPFATEARVATTSESRLPGIRRALIRVLGAPVFEDRKTSIFTLDHSESPCGEGGLMRSAIR